MTDRGAGVCVGRIVTPNDVRIIAISDDAIDDWSQVRELPAGEVGEITVAGPSATTAYFGRPEATCLAKIKRDGVIVHRMGDVGYLDADGFLWFCGRKSHRVELADRTLFSTPVEEIFNTHPAVFRTALVGVNVGSTRQPVVCVERDPESATAKTLTDAQLIEALKALAANFDHTRMIEHFLFHPGFPVDIRHNAKIGREKLTVWAQGKFA